MASTPAKRVSMKGRGADLFFGDYAPPVAEDPATGGDVVPTPSPPSADAVPATGYDGPVDADAMAPAGPSPRPPSARPSVLVEPDIVEGGTEPDPTIGRPSTPPVKRLRRRSSKQASIDASTLASLQAELQSSEQAVSLASMQASLGLHQQATSLASMQANDVDSIEAIRRALREPGREVAYVRLTPEEKGLVGDIVHAYKKRGQRTTENELHRIAINHLLQDYHEYGEESVLARVLASLRA